mgnify:CR=1 FL=1
MSLFLALIFYLLPLLAYARTITEVITGTDRAFRTGIIGITFIFVTIIFFWGVVIFIAKGDNPEERKKGKTMMLWGIIGIAVIASVWGVVEILINFFGVGNVPTPQPKF